MILTLHVGPRHHMERILFSFHHISHPFSAGMASDFAGSDLNSNLIVVFNFPINERVRAGSDFKINLSARFAIVV